MTMSAKDVPNLVRVPAKLIKLCSVEAKYAADLTVDEMRDLVKWCNCQDENFWSDLCLQEILNVYRVSAEWQLFSQWYQEDHNSAIKAYNRVVAKRNHLAVG